MYLVVDEDGCLVVLQHIYVNVYILVFSITCSISILMLQSGEISMGLWEKFQTIQF
jgi:hypothetical protein